MTTGTISAKNLKQALQSIHIPPVYYFLVIFTLVGVTLDQLFASGNILSNPVIMTNILVRSVALGIVAVGQSFVMIGAAIDLSVAFTISLTAVLASQIMQGDPARVSHPAAREPATAQVLPPSAVSSSRRTASSISSRC